MPRRFLFVGVTTGESSIMPIFPRWRNALGLDPRAEIVGRDLPIHAPVEQYRETVAWLKDDPDNLGALVTTHKIDLFHAAHDLFDEIDSYGRLLTEVSCIAQRDGRLLGWAKDPISAGRALREILHPGYFGRTGAEVLCLGAGGAGNAIALHLLHASNADDRPGRIVLTDPDSSRLHRLEALHAECPRNVTVEYFHTGDRVEVSRLMSELPPSSLIINATGLGKDRPGSPVSDDGQFPLNGIAWDLNYRGELRFLQQARKQEGTRSLRVQDGWKYFIHGWATVIEEVFQRPITENELSILENEAVFARPASPTRGMREYP